MSENVADWLAKLNGLPTGDRAEIAFHLLQSLPPDAFDPNWEEAWSAELQCRTAAIENGQAHEVPADEVIAALRKKYS